MCFSGALAGVREESSGVGRRSEELSRVLARPPSLNCHNSSRTPSPTLSSSAAPSAARYASSRAILGAELFEKVESSRVLVVGFVSSFLSRLALLITSYSAGGIGCELIKNMGAPSWVQ